MLEGPHGALLTTFCADIIETILGFSSIPTLLKLQATSTAHYLAVRQHIHRRSRLLVRPFVTMPENLYLILRLTKSAISGSSALRFMLPLTSRSWAFKDLDIYTPAAKSTIVMNFFKLEGYRVLKQSKAKGPYRVGTFDVITLTKGHLSVDIVVIKQSENFFTAVSRFHLSCVINFITADGFFSAYPTLTEAEYSLVSHLFMEEGTLVPKNATVKAYRKYQDRGFKLLHIPSAVDTGLPRTEYNIPAHRCGKSVWCPHTPRTTNDPHCLYVSFEANLSSITSRKASDRGLYRARFGTIWMLGGRSCNGVDNVLRPFSSTLGYESE